MMCIFGWVCGVVLALGTAFWQRLEPHQGDTLFGARGGVIAYEYRLVYCR